MFYNYYEKRILLPLLISKGNKKESHFSNTELKGIRLSIQLKNLKSIEDLAITNSLLVLEQIGGQKARLKNFRRIFVKRSSKIKTKIKKGVSSNNKRFFVTCEVTLRKEKINDFLDYFNTYVIKMIQKKRYFYKQKVAKNNTLSLFFGDINLFPNLPEYIYFGSLGINISLLFNSEKNKQSAIEFYENILNVKDKIN